MKMHAGEISILPRSIRGEAAKGARERSFMPSGWFYSPFVQLHMTSAIKMMSSGFGSGGWDG
jgi:hypothetical protein